MPTQVQPKGVKAHRTMLVARQSFTTWYDGDRVEILAGASYVVPGHPIAVANPDRFAPASGPAVPAGRGSHTAGPTERYTSAPMQMTGRGAPKVKTSTAGPTERYAPGDARARRTVPSPNTHSATGWDDDDLPRPTWAFDCMPNPRSTGEVPLVRSTTSPITVRLGSSLHKDLRSITRRTPPSHETGGMLIATRDAPSKLIEARPPGSSSHLGRSSLRLDWQVEHSRIRDEHLRNNNIIVAGMWHTHPRGSQEPSPPDLGLWADAWAHANESVFPIRHYIGVIATNVRDTGGPDLTAWVVRRPRERGALVAERAAIKVA